MKPKTNNFAIPTDQSLYERVKKEVYTKIPKHSAYRSGILVQTYKRRFAAKYGSSRSPYLGKKKDAKTAKLSRWFLEEWKNQRGGVGYQFKGDVYRPTRIITPQTPKTYFEIDKKTLAKARRSKAKGLRASFY